MSDTITSTKPEQTGELLWDNRCYLSAWVSAYLAHKFAMSGCLVYLLIIKYLSVLFEFSHSILDWTAISWNLLLLIF